MLSFQHSESNWVVYHNSENDWISTHSSPCMQVAILEWGSYCLASLLPSWLEVMSSCLHLTWLSICSKYDILTLGEHAYFFLFSAGLHVLGNRYCSLVWAYSSQSHWEMSKGSASSPGCVVLFRVCHRNEMVSPVLLQSVDWVYLTGRPDCYWKLLWSWADSNGSPQMTGVWL